uniref:Zinc finger CCHC domain-containing protein 7 n=1 Tax=Culex tarsalis TaxID=7177 RepID=A0A1Q3FVR4_CULTA
MDLNEHELAELEERLYSSIHHASDSAGPAATESPAAGTLPAADKQTSAEPAPSSCSTVRIVTDKAIVNASKMKRYWSSMQNYPGVGRPNKPRNSGAPSSSVEASRAEGEGDGAGKKAAAASFTPYQSILGPSGIGGGSGSSSPRREFLLMEGMPSVGKQKRRRAGEGKKVLNPSSLRGKKMEQLQKIKAKKAKASKSRQKAQVGQQRLVATIELESSDGEHASPDAIKQERREIERQELEDSDPDEVVLVPSAPPPLVCIESSDEDGTKDKFTHPKSKKKKANKKVNSPRCLSPSNSSIMSDDFIGQNDRTRLNDSFIEGIANDEELVGQDGPSGNALFACELPHASRADRAPSISSEGTVATSSDTTDQDKRNRAQTVAPPPAKPTLCSTPKQTTLHARRASAKSRDQPEEDSIYTATSAKKSKPASSGGDSSEESDDGESRSKRSKSYHSDASSTKSSKKQRKKRRKKDSEHYSDEDFASILTDIVQAISENEGGSSDDDQPAEPEAIVEPVQNVPDGDILEIKDQEPNKISLPQVEPRENFVKAPTPEALHVDDSNDVVAIEPPPPQLINLADEDTRDERIPGLRRIDDDPECCWNEEMKKFYHESWNCEDFNVSTVLFNMPRQAKHWPIVHKDKYPDPPKKEIICNNCQQPGHMKYKCRRPPKPPTCYMCGLIGHQETRCPNTLCLRCGEKTANFLRGCHACSREQHMTCHLCGIRGHAQRNCPDKWRRYHSTIEADKPLTRDYERNPNGRHCCICARPGHQAHACHAALRIFGQFVPTTEVINYQPVYYPERQESQDRATDQGQPRFNLFSEEGDFELNFDDSIAKNESSFYHRFTKSVGLLEKRKKREERLARKMKRDAKRRKKAGGEGEEVEAVPEVEPVDEIREEGVGRDGHGSKSANEDSNYSFSEFYEDKTSKQQQQLGTASEPMPDFIPLTSTDESANHAFAVPASVEQNTEAKIFLTKPHAKILLGPNGTNFLKDASAKFTLNLSIAFQPVGNVLLANGLSQNQDNFHNELVKFLNSASHQNEQLRQINNVPKGTEKTIRYIVEHLQLLTRSYENVKSMFRRYQHCEQQGMNPKTCDKVRRNLNIILFGQFGLRQGRDHLNQLQSNLQELKATANPIVSLETRDEINQHIRYIFTSYDHSDYEDIMQEYDTLRKSQKLTKVKPEDLNLTLPPASTAPESKDAADESFNVSKEFSFDDSSLASDLILNTSDQLIDAAEVSKREEKEASPPVALPEENPASGSSPDATPKTGKAPSSKQTKVEFLLNNCRQMVKQLDNKPIAAKFDQIYEQTREGNVSKANYRTLMGIHAILKSKLNRKKKKKIGSS